MFALYNTMDAPAFKSALKHYQAVKRASAKYYETHRDEISERRKEKYRQAHPTPAPRGRPKKNLSVDGTNETDAS